MELWIRSQDKECLVKISNIQYVLRKETNCGISTEYHYIGTYYDNLKILGTYKTKERALEVLTEIQNILSPKYILDTSSIKPIGDPYYVENGVIFQRYGANGTIQELSTVVYEMPEK